MQLSHNIVGDEYNAMTGLAISSDGRFAFTGTANRRLLVWDMERQVVVAKVELESLCANHLVVSPDGRYLVSGGGGRYEHGEGWRTDGDYDLRVWRLVLPVSGE